MALGSKSSEEKSSRDVSGRDKEKKRELCARITVEHVVTVGQVRMHYFQAPLDKIKDEDFIAAALCPVAVITKDAEKLLKRGKTKKDSQWPREHPFERYVPKGSEEIRVVTFDGQPVDPGTWTWDDHWKLIGRSDRLKPLRDKLSDISETRWQLP
jgi:hypothetical protein